MALHWALIETKLEGITSSGVGIALTIPVSSLADDHSLETGYSIEAIRLLRTTRCIGIGTSQSRSVIEAGTETPAYCLGPAPVWVRRPGPGVLPGAQSAALPGALLGTPLRPESPVALPPSAAVCSPSK